MSEPKINVATGFQGGVSVSLRADTAAEFDALLADALTSPNLAGQLAKAGLAVSEAQAIQTVQSAFPQATVQSTVGGVPAQPLPQPNVPAATPGDGAIPPGVVNPGPCAHGPRVFKNSMARGKPWLRWDCALEWVKGNEAHNAQRCKAVNV